MAFDYGNIRDTVALPLIKEFGQPIVVYRTEDTVTYTRVYNPVTMKYYWVDDIGTQYDTEPTETQVEYEGFGIVKTYDTEAVDGTLIRADDILLISTGIPQPQMGDIFLVNGKEYQFVNNQTVAPGGVDIVYKTQVRV